MKKTIFYFAIIFICILTFKDSLSQWEQMSNGIGSNKWAYSLVANGNNIFAGIQGSGVFLSTNNGENWTAVNYGLKSLAVQPLAVLGTKLFAGTMGAGIFSSTNNGSNWAPSSLGLYDLNIELLAVKDTNIFAATHTGVYISADTGKTWHIMSLGLPNLNVQAFAFLSKYIFAGIYSRGVYAKTDRFAWYEVNNGITYFDVRALIVSGNNIFAGTMGGGIFKSSNFGNNWTIVNNGLSNGNVISFTTSGTNIFAGTAETSGGVFLSTNDGASWLNKSQGLYNMPNINALLVINGYIFAGTGHQSIWRRSMDDILGLNNIIPPSFSLLQNYPNPFNPQTVIKFNLPVRSEVLLIVYDIRGREVQTLVNGKLKAGIYKINFNRSSLSSGIYFYKIKANEFSETKRMIILK